MKIDRILFNKLTLSIFFGIATAPFLMWYVIVEMLNHQRPLGIVISVFIGSVFLGLVGGPWISSLVRYQLAPDAAVIGFPFPSVFLEPQEEGSDTWIDFPWALGYFLNICYWFLVSLVAILWLTG